jgi:chromosome segregation ATPase
LSDIIAPSARHDDPGLREASQPLVRTLYKLAGRAGQDGTRDQIAYIVSQFVSFQQLQRPLLQAFEGVAKTAAKYPEMEQEAAVLRAAVGERDAIIETADRRANGAEARLADAVAEIEAARAQIVELAREREARAEFEREASGLRVALVERETALAELSRRADELLAAQQAVQAELAAREAALHCAERGAQERAAAVEAMQSEIAALQDAVAKAEAGTQERAAAAEAMQAQIAALRGGLARAEREAQQRTDSEAALQSEIAGLRTMMAQAERAAQERANNMAALQAEIGTLQQTLTAARQVGKAAIAAFRIDAVAAARPDRPRGWRRAVMGLFGAGTRLSSHN